MPKGLLWAPLERARPRNPDLLMVEDSPTLSQHTLNA
jgi:hypothetical protein